MRATFLFLTLQLLPTLGTDRTTRPVREDRGCFGKFAFLKNFESVILIPKVLLDSGIYQGDLKRGVPHGEVGVDSIIGVLA